MTGAEVRYFENPRNEDKENTLQVNRDTFIKLGLDPIKLSDGLLTEVIDVARRYSDRCDRSKIVSQSLWKSDKSVDYVGSKTPLG